LLEPLEKARAVSYTAPEWCFVAAQKKIKRGDYDFDVDLEQLQFVCMKGCKSRLLKLQLKPISESARWVRSTGKVVTQLGDTGEDHYPREGYWVATAP
jgi:hypothetical protein